MGLHLRIWSSIGTALLACVCLTVGGWGLEEAQGQLIDEFPPELLAELIPGADRFTQKQGDPPVFEAFATDPATGLEMLVGYAFVTSDLPPEVQGYSAPITVLVGMDLGGTLTGVEILAYRESLRGSRGDFLNRGSYIRQFGGKHVAEPFRLRNDIDGISGASITVDAMARGIRNSARRVAAAYLSAAPPDASSSYIGTVGLEELDGLLWAEMLNRGLATQVSIVGGPLQMVLSMVYLSESAVGEMLVGSRNFQTAIDTLGARDDGSHMMLMGLGGRDPFFFRASGLIFVQGDDTFSVPAENLQMFPLLRDGKLQGEVRRSGLLYVDGALDLSQRFEVSLDLGPRGEASANSYQVMPPQRVVAAGPNAAPRGAGAGEPTIPGTSGQDGSQIGSEEVALAIPGGAPTGAQANVGAGPSVGPGVEAAGPAAAAGGQAIDYEALLFEDEELEQTALSRVLERTSWPRVAGLAILLALASWTVVTKSAGLRWITLGATFLVLGYVDGGFLSVSHILAGISVGPSVYLEDLPLLLLVSFAVVTTILWGRIFCGFLCPFGALQDLMERIVPRRFRRELPRGVHEKALLVKYGILGLILVPALVGSSVTIFQYFEPFGTVFYWSSSLLLWTITGGILVVSAIVPRFYCRYACPLGAALAIGSLAAPFRIGRIEQCDFCKVCEQKCPTGAIDGPKIDFKECVRCNACEIQLIERAGVCQHDMETIRGRLVKLPMAVAGPTDG